MSSLALFWLIAGLLCAIIIWVFWRTLGTNASLQMQSVQQRNIAIARERALEIHSALEAEELTAAEHDQAIRDLELTLADELSSSKELRDQFKSTSTRSHLLILCALPLLSFAVYQQTSTYSPQGPSTEPTLQNTETPSLEEMLQRLEANVRTNPEDQQGLYLLANTYAQLQRYSESATRYQQLIALTEPNADLLSSYADVSAMANDQLFTPAIADTLKAALALDPEHNTTLWLLGLAEQQHGQEYARGNAQLLSVDCQS